MTWDDGSIFVTNDTERFLTIMNGFELAKLFGDYLDSSGGEEGWNAIRDRFDSSARLWEGGQGEASRDG